jgi:NTE family protein
MASACLPFLFQAVEIDGQHYWDGGYIGNPPLFPLINETKSQDILIVQINPVNIDTIPKNAREVLDRINTLSFNSSLMRELRAVYFVTSLIDNGELNPEKHKRIFLHTIEAERVVQGLGVSSKLNTDPEYLKFLFESGKQLALDFLHNSFDKIGVESSTDIAAKFM